MSEKIGRARIATLRRHFDVKGGRALADNSKYLREEFGVETKEELYRMLNGQYKLIQKEERRLKNNKRAKEGMRALRARRTVNTITRNIFENVKFQQKKEKSAGIIQRKWLQHKFNKYFKYTSESEHAMFKHVEHKYFCFVNEQTFNGNKSLNKDTNNILLSLLQNNKKIKGWSLKDVNSYYDGLQTNFIEDPKVPISMKVIKHNSILLKEIYQTILKKLKTNQIRVGINASYLFRKKMDKKDMLDKTFQYRVMHKNTGYKTILNTTDIDQVLDDKLQWCDDQIDQLKASWEFVGYTGITLKLNTFKPINGGSYIELPDWLKGPKRGLTNIQNMNNNRCFWLCLILHKMGGPENVNNTHKESTYNNHWNKIKIPKGMNLNKAPCLHEMKTICNMNEVNLTIVHAKKNTPDNISPLFIYKPNNDWKTLHLLLLEDKENDNRSHYIYIKNKNSFLGSFMTNHKEAVFVCDHCHMHYHSQEKLDEHAKFGCQNHDSVKLIMPKEKSFIKFNQHIRTIRKPFAIYADIESFTCKTNNTSAGGAPTPSVTSAHSAESATIKNQHHQCSAIGYCVIDEHKKLSSNKIQYYTCNSAVEFLKSIITKATEIQNIADEYKNLDDKPKCKDTTCWVCQREIFKNSAGPYEKVDCKCPYSSIDYGACHTKCRDLYLANMTEIDVFFHNGKHYDFHYIMQAVSDVAKDYKKFDVSPIFINNEKQLSIQIAGIDNEGKSFSIAIKDSLQFMTMSIAGLVNSLKNSNHEFKYMKEMFGDKDELLTQKGHFFYDFYDGPDKNMYTKMPPIEAFYSELTKKGLTDKEYEHACYVWDVCNCQTTGDYMHVYLKTDVILLADIFEAFRNLCLRHYKLDPCHYYTAPGMAWSAALKVSGAQLELLTDEDMVLMFEKGMRGGISMISHRYAKANNKYMEDYNPAAESSYILYQDMNNLYGGAMVMPLPTKNFKWEENVNSFNEEFIKNLNWKDSVGYTFMVDLEYPTELHDLHNQYPLAPERFTVTPEMTSKYNHDLASDANDKIKHSEKLVPNLHNKKEYVVHGMTLQKYLELGLKISKVHKVISYTQEPWLKRYIMLNTNQRIEAKNNKNKFLEDFYKLMNNSVFGKTMENVRNRSNLKLLINNEANELMTINEAESSTNKKMSFERKLLRHLAKPTLKNVTIFSENMICIDQAKTEIVMNKPIYCGQSILDISKIFMYDYHYNTMMKQYGPEKCQLLFTDTDSLCYHIKTDDLYKDMFSFKDQLDTSNYAKDHPLYSHKNMAVLGKMKDETAGKPINEFVGLKPKMYAYSTEEKEEKRAKGVSSVMVKEDKENVRKVIMRKEEGKQITTDFIRLKDYKDVVFNKTNLYVEQKSIRSYKHQIYTIQQRKLALSGIDTKRYILEDGISSLAYGHYKIPK
jgi:hypothetical protein